jgi:hypothetical protein
VINIALYGIWTIGKILFYYLRKENKFNSSIIQKSLALGVLSLIFMYITNVYIFGALPYISGRFRLLLFIMPFLTDLTTEFAITKLKSPFADKKQFETQFLSRVITFPMIALAYELILIVGMYCLLLLAK